MKVRKITCIILACTLLFGSVGASALSVHSSWAEDELGEAASDAGLGRTPRLLIALAVLAAITLALNRVLPRSRP